MRKGEGIMKYLEIKNNNVYFVNQDNDEKPLDEISKEDILFILEKSLEEEFEYDLYDDSLIQNQVHNIIYKDISKKLESFIANKQKMEEDIDSQYKEAWDKYCNNIDEERHTSDRVHAKRKMSKEKQEMWV